MTEHMSRRSSGLAPGDRAEQLAGHMAPDGWPLHLDPALVTVPALLRFRAPQSFAGAEFAQLKTSIAHLCGNVQPIKVLPGTGGRHELVFGTRRLQACLELGMPVTAVVDAVTGPRMVAQLDASNDDAQVSVYERGCLYQAALAAGLFPSQRRLAESLGRPLRYVADALTVAQLPRQMLDSLRDPRALKVGESKRLAAALRADPAGFASRLAQANLGQNCGVKFALQALLPGAS